MKTTRRIFASLLVLAAPLLILSAAQTPNRESEKKQEYLAFVGTYTTKTASKGIYAFRYDGHSGKLTAVGVAAESPDPSFVAVHPSGKYVYAVNEAGKSSAVSAFALDPHTGQLTRLNQKPALGEDPCYISFDRSGKFVLIANYTSGNVAVFPILADGKLGEHTALVQDDGELGPNKERQEGPHAHWIETTPDNRFVLSVDLGLDEILIYKFDASKGTLTPNQPAFAKLAGGTGPRHFTFAPSKKFAYSVDELNSTVTVFSFDASTAALSVLQTISTVPNGTTGRNDTAEIAVHPSGKFLYASNRGHDTIALFHIDAATGKLSASGEFSIDGKEPRNFVIDPSGAYLLSADQLSDKIVVFRINPETGELKATGQSVDVPSPVDIAFTPAE
jgi:6-phosphogluconolactonase